MKYVYLAIFNICALYMLSVFLFGNGGITSNIKKIQTIQELQAGKTAGQIELEELKTKWNYLKTLSSPDHSAIASSGRKTSDMIIFKFVNQKKETAAPIPDLNRIVFYRIYFSFGVVLLFLIIGNAALIHNCLKPDRER